MRICLIVGLIFSFSLAPLKAQMRFKDPDGPLHFQINFESADLWKEEKTGEWSKVTNLTFENVESRDIPLNSRLFPFSNSMGTLLILEGTGQVFQLDQVRRRLTRIDKTFYRGYNFGAIRFIRKDTLYSVGGNGFWHVNNIETYFSLKSKEWELQSMPDGNGPKQMRSDFGGYNQYRDVLSVLDFPPQYQSKNNSHQYHYFEKKINEVSWKCKGELNISLLRKLGVNKFESTFIQGVFLFRNGPFIVLGDPFKNELYEINQVVPLLSEHFELSEKNGYIYSYHESKNSTKLEHYIKVDSISISHLKSLGKYKGEFYVKPISPLIFQISFGIILLILGFLLGFWIKKAQKNNSLVTISDSEFSILDGLPDGAYEFLKASLALPKGHHFSSQAFTELMGFSSYAYETQRQVRSKLIKAINAYFSIHYKMHDVIIRKTANDDKRFSIYYISEEHYERLKELLGGD
ncbi:hypothetical protein SKC35_00805 [Aquirufa sp. KTFRIE-69F]|uniref:DUF4350 domain-containing protein n=1 Tax=Aquirufa originis TaxID=3096514 RepID=A0ABW6D2E6_9BACT